LKKILGHVGFNCVFECDVNNYDLKAVEVLLENNKDLLLVVNGEGTFHDDQSYALFLLSFIDKYAERTLLMNTQFKDMPSANVKVLNRLKLFQVRTKKDYLWCSNAGVEGHVYCPDMLFYSGLKNLICPQSHKVIFTDSHDPSESESLFKCYQVAKDSEWVNFHYIQAGVKIQKGSELLRLCALSISLYDEWKYTNWKNRTYLPQLLYKFLSAGCVVTGRYHAACLAILFEKNLYIAGSNTSKISDLCEDFGVGMPYDKFKGGCVEELKKADLTVLSAGESRLRKALVNVI
jgi:hypothetical protein